MSFPIIGKSISTGISHFFFSNETRTYQLDQQKSINILFLLYSRELLLKGTSATLNLSIPGLGYTALSLGGCKALLYGLKQLNANDAYKNILPDIKTLKAYDQKIDDLLNHIDPYVNAACLATYVALIYFGNPLPGIIGISFLALGYLKQQGKLPSYLDAPIKHLSIPCSIFSTLTSKMHILFKTIQIARIAIKTLSISLKNSSTDYISNFGKHEIDQTSTLNHFLKCEKKNVFEKTSNPKNFSANKTSVYAFKWPTFFSEQEQKLSNAEIQSKLEQICKDLDIIPKEEPSNDSITTYPRLTGWKRLSQMLLTGSLEEQTPNNIYFFFDLIKGIIFSTLKDTDTGNQKTKLEKLLKICEQCPVGWTADAEELQFPDSNIESNIHKNLAVYRDTLIQKILCKITETEGPDYFESCGGVNNVHLLENLSSTLWHEWKTFRGEMSSHFHGKGILTRSIESSTRLSSDTKNSILFSIGATVDISLCSKVILLNERLPREMRELYNAEAITEHIQSQIAYGVIRWDSVSSWMSKLQEESGIEFILEETSEYNPQWTLEVKDPISEKTTRGLTKEGTTLLLWDLNILSVTNETDK